MKRGVGSQHTDAPSPKRRQVVKLETYKKWLVENDKACQTLSRLDCESKIESVVQVIACFKCIVRIKYREKLVWRKKI